MGADSPAKIPRMPQKFSAQNVCPIAPKFEIFEKKASLSVRSLCLLESISKSYSIAMFDLKNQGLFLTQ